jgi:hypothetical protein
VALAVIPFSLDDDGTAMQMRVVGDVDHHMYTMFQALTNKSTWSHGHTKR